MGSMSQLPRSWRVCHHTLTSSANLLGVEGHHVTATKKFGVVASYLHRTCGYIQLGVGVADAAKALALVVCIDPAGVRVPGVAATKMDIGRPPYRR